MPRLSQENIIDPITREVINSSLLAYADEMTNNFWRTSYSYMNYEMRDYAVGLVDHAGRIITQSRLTHPAFTAMEEAITPEPSEPATTFEDNTTTPL